MKTRTICSRDGFLQAEIQKAQGATAQEFNNTEFQIIRHNRSKNRHRRLVHALFDIRTNARLGMYLTEPSPALKHSYAEILGVGSFDPRQMRLAVMRAALAPKQPVVDDLPDPKPMLELIDRRRKPVGSARRYRDRLLRKERSKSANG